MKLLLAALCFAAGYCACYVLQHTENGRLLEFRKRIGYDDNQ